MPESELANQLTATRAALPSWSALSLRSRIAIIERFRTELFRRRTDAASVVSAETGKPIPESLVAEVSTVLDGARFLVNNAARILRPRKIRPASLALWRKRIVVHHQPVGVIAVISPWNYPLLFTAMHVLPALVAGNTVLLKPSELTPRSADLLHELLMAAGLPPNVFQIVHGDGVVGAALVNAPIDKVLFTGSERTGRRIAEACAPRFIPVSLELGSSDAAIVLADADVKHAASGIVWGRYANAGQTCVAPKRAIVNATVFDAFVNAVTFNVEQLHIGEANDAQTDVGRMISPAQAELLSAQIADAIAKGARVVAQQNPAHASSADAVYSPLIVLADVTTNMRVWNEETFGPVLAVVRATDDEDALRQANASRYGLSGSVWSGNRPTARAMALRMNAGAVAVNDCVITAGVAEVPHGGMNDSGFGRVHGDEGLLECVRTKTVVDDILPAARQPWWFGYGPESSNRLDAYLRLTHGHGLAERLGGIVGTLRMLLRPERPV